MNTGSQGPPGTVVLIHGLMLGAWAMARVATAARRCGFTTLNLSYASRTRSFNELVRDWLPAQLTRHGIGLGADAPPLHFVTQSMGGLIVRGWLRDHGTPAALRRVVMFAPPNHGTPLVDHLSRRRWFRSVFGVTAPHLGTHGLSARLGPWPQEVELGVIAGDGPVLPALVRWCDEPNDGKVPVSSTRLEGMRDHVVLPYSHTWLQYRGRAIEQAVHFLQQGRFKHSGRA